MHLAISVARERTGASVGAGLESDSGGCTTRDAASQIAYCATRVSAHIDDDGSSVPFLAAGLVGTILKLSLPALMLFAFCETLCLQSSKLVALRLSQL